MVDVRIISGRTSLGKPRSGSRWKVNTKERLRNGIRKCEPFCFRTQSSPPPFFKTPMNVGVWQDRHCTYKRNIVARSCNHCSRRKAVFFRGKKY